MRKCAQRGRDVGDMYLLFQVAFRQRVLHTYANICSIWRLGPAEPLHAARTALPTLTFAVSRWRQTASASSVADGPN